MGPGDLVLDLSFLSAACVPHFHLRVTRCRELIRFFTAMSLLSVSPPSFSLLPICYMGPLSLCSGWTPHGAAFFKSHPQRDSESEIARVLSLSGRGDAGGRAPSVLCRCLCFSQVSQHAIWLAASAGRPQNPAIPHANVSAVGTCTWWFVRAFERACQADATVTHCLSEEPSGTECSPLTLGPPPARARA